MLFYLFKIFLTVTIIVVINVISRRSPQLGGWIAALPVVSVLSVAWLLSDGASVTTVRSFVSSVLFGLIPTGIMLCAIAFSLYRGLSLPASLLYGVSLWLFATFIAQKIGIISI